jgi:GNAT superfamily N-acetyltransferase
VRGKNPHLDKQDALLLAGFMNGARGRRATVMSARVPPESSPVVIRGAHLRDLAGMARVHVDVWKTTYRGIVPDAHLDSLCYESDIAHGFGRWLNQPPPGEAHFVALTPPEDIVGFAIGGPNRDSDPDFTGELRAIYVLKSSQGRGIGSTLVSAVARHLLSIGLDSMLVWVLEQNPYRRFYEKLGGVDVRRRIVPVAGTPLPEIGYGWKDIRRLAGT